MLQTRAVSQAARSGLGTVKSQTQAKSTHEEQGKREAHIRGGKWGNETPGLTQAGREQQF